MTIKMKAGVRLSPVQAVIVMVTAVREAFGAYPCVITSGMDGTHGDHSLHYKGEAMDFRTKFLPDAEKDRILSDIKSRLTSDFDVLLESRGQDNEHLHCEWDPKPVERGEA